MKLRALRLWNVRKFANRGIALENIRDGVNVLSAENEFGKSTSFDALHSLFFQNHTGTSKAIQMLRPYSGGSPQIEADIETKEGLFRINKQFYAGKHAIVSEIATGRIIAQSDAAEDWIFKLVRGGISGPAGLLWVQQGIFEIGKGSKAENEDERKVRENLLTSFTGDEVERLTGGRRMVHVLERTREELEKLVTPSGKPKAASPYAKALDDRVKLAAEKEILGEKIEKMRGDLNARRVATARLNEINDPKTIESRKIEFNQAQQDFEQAQTHSSKQKEAMQLHENALIKRELSKANLESFEAKEQRCFELKENLDTIHETHDNLNKKLLEAQTRLNHFKTTDKEHQKTIERFYENFRLANLQQKSELAIQNFEKLNAQLDKAQKTKLEIEKLHAQSNALLIHDDAVKKLENLEKQIAILEGTIAASSAQFKVNYIDADSPLILRDGMAIEDEKIHWVSTPQTLKIPKIGTLTLVPNSDEETHRKQSQLTALKNSLLESLTALGFSSVLEAKNQQNLYQQVLANLELKQSEFSLYAPEGLKALQSNVAKLKTQIASPSDSTEKLNLDDIKAQLEQTKKSAAQNNEKLKNAQATFDGRKSAYLQIGSEQKAAQNSLTELQQELGDESERKRLASRLSTAHMADNQKAQLALEQVEILAQNAPNFEKAQASFMRHKSIMERQDNEREKLEIEIAGLDGRIEISSEQAIEENHQEVCGKLLAVEKQILIFEREIAALKLLKQTLEEARVLAKEHFFKPVMNELKPLLNMMFSDASVYFNEKDLAPNQITRQGQKEDIAVLSGGMREQIAILTRLAFARLLAKSGHSVPVILDDALVYSDDTRIESMFDALHSQANDIQILVLTCRERAFQALGGNFLTITEWHPKNL